MMVKFVGRSNIVSLLKSLYWDVSVTGNESRPSLISISDTEQEKQEVVDLWQTQNIVDTSVNFLPLSFADIDTQESGFTDEIALQIKDFVDEALSLKQDIVVHCFLGVSRSGAVAKYINEYLGLGDEYLENYTGHNRFVYNKLLKVSGIETQQEYYRRLEISQKLDKIKSARVSTTAIPMENEPTCWKSADTINGG